MGIFTQVGCLEGGKTRLLDCPKAPPLLGLLGFSGIPSFLGFLGIPSFSPFIRNQVGFPQTRAVSHFSERKTEKPDGFGFPFRSSVFQLATPGEIALQTDGRRVWEQVGNKQAPTPKTGCCIRRPSSLVIWSWTGLLFDSRCWGLRRGSQPYSKGSIASISSAPLSDFLESALHIVECSCLLSMGIFLLGNLGFPHSNQFVKRFSFLPS